MPRGGARGFPINHSHIHTRLRDNKYNILWPVERLRENSSSGGGGGGGVLMSVYFIIRIIICVNGVCDIITTIIAPAEYFIRLDARLLQARVLYIIILYTRGD
jgi:hypothetical protein